MANYSKSAGVVAVNAKSIISSKLPVSIRQLDGSITIVINSLALYSVLLFKQLDV